MTSDLMRSDWLSRIGPWLQPGGVPGGGGAAGDHGDLGDPSFGAVQHRLELARALRRLRVGLDRSRMAAERDRQPCAMQLNSYGWQPPLAGDLPSCRGGVTPFMETGAGVLELRSNLPDEVRFSTNGLVLDGGLVVLSTPAIRGRCMVISLPLGISRSGVYRGDPSGPLRPLPPDDA